MGMRLETLWARVAVVPRGGSYHCQYFKGLCTQPCVKRSIVFYSFLPMVPKPGGDMLPVFAIDLIIEVLGNGA